VVPCSWPDAGSVGLGRFRAGSAARGWSAEGKSARRYRFSRVLIRADFQVGHSLKRILSGLNDAEVLYLYISRERERERTHEDDEKRTRGWFNRNKYMTFTHS